MTNIMPVPLSSNKKKDNTYVRYLMGRDIDRYSICPEKEQWISYGDWLAEPRPMAPFFDPIKILRGLKDPRPRIKG